VNVVPISIVRTNGTVVGTIVGHTTSPTVVGTQGWKKFNFSQLSPLPRDAKMILTFKHVAIGRGELLIEDVGSELDVV
jgi:hypothetical protein